MHLEVLVLLVFITGIQSQSEECIECTEDITTGCYVDCDVTLNIALGGTVYQYHSNRSINTLTFQDKHIIALRSNPRTGVIYFSTLDAIWKYDKAAANGPSVEQIQAHSVHNPTSVEVDMSTGNIYWIDRTLSTIFASGPDGKNKSTILALPFGHDPYSLTLSSNQGVMYWTDAYNGSVWSATMGGKHLQLVRDGLNFPTGIAQKDMFLYVVQLGADTHHPDTLIRIDPLCKLPTGCLNNAITLSNGTVYQSKYSHIGVVGESLYIPSVQDYDVIMTKVDMSSSRVTVESLMSWDHHSPDQIPRFDVSSYTEGLNLENVCQNANCKYLCVKSTVGAVCLCRDGYQLAIDNFSCTLEPQTLLFTDQLNVMSLNLQTKQETILDFGGTRMQVGVGLDYDQLDNTVYWSDIRAKQIVKAVIGGGAPVVLTSDVEKPSGICVDWVTKYIYYFDDEYNTLNVISNDGADRATILTYGDHPRSIKVDPISGYLFWSDRGEAPKILRSKLSGAEVTIMANLTAGSYPNGIALDMPNKMVYWIDGVTDNIMGTGYDSSSAATVVVELPNSQGFSLALLDGYFYWSDWQRKIIGRVDMTNNGSITETVIPAFGVVMDIVTHGASFTLGTSNACSNSPCSHFCYNTGDSEASFTCGCPDGVQLEANSLTNCEQSQCEQSNGGCNQLCSLDENRQVVCSCNDFYENVLGTCVDSYLLLATKYKIWQVSVLGDSAHRQTDIPVRGKVVALDFDTVNGRVFWTDTLVDAIFMADINGTTAAVVLDTELQTPDGIAYDWVTNSIYWSDMGTKIIGCTKPDGAYRKTVLTFADSDKPRAMVLDPKQGLMYYTDWGANSGIFRCWMDGQNVTKIASGDISWPNGLAIDRQLQVLYWVDAKEDRLEKVSVDGTGRVIMTSLTNTHAFALTLFNDMILLTDWRHKQIIQVNSTNSSEFTFYSDETQTFTTDQPFDIHWYSASVQIDTNECGSDNGGCSHFCFFTPQGAKCGCPQNIQLEEDGKTCIRDPCSIQNGGCDHTCFVSERSNVTCSCNAWFKPNPANTSQCIESSLSLFVLERNALLEVSMDTDPLQRKQIDIQPPIQSGASLALDYRAGRVYWSDSLHDTISSANLDGTEVRVIITDLQVPDGVAFDWLARNIYWTDTGPDKIFVARYDGSHVHELKITGHDRPRAIVLSPMDRVVFWSDWGAQAVIGRANMDGTGQIVLVDSGLGWPNGLAFDQVEKVVYWVDALEDKLESVTMAGTDRRLISESHLQHPYGFHYFDDHLYWSDWTSQGIKKIHKSGVNYTDLMSFGTALMDLTMASPDEQMPAPCYLEGEAVPQYDMLNSVLYVAVKGYSALVNLTITYAGVPSYMQLQIEPSSIQLFDLGSNAATQTVSFPSPIYPGDSQDYVKFFYISHGVCYKRYGGKYLSGYTTGRRRGYRNLMTAKEACETYTDCRGVTYEQDDQRLYKFTLRQGSLPHDSENNEISWLMVECANGKSDTLTIGSGKEIGQNKLMEITESFAHTITQAVVARSETSETWLCPGYMSPCHVDNGGCEGLCLVNPTGRSCACQGDLDPYGVKCSKHRHLLLGATNDLLLYQLGGDLSAASTETTVARDESLITSIDYIYTSDTDTTLSSVFASDQVIWSEPNYGAVRAAAVDGTRTRDLYRQGGGVITSVVYNWVSKVVVWLDSTLGIFLSSLDGTHRTSLYVEYSEPRILAYSESLAVDPYKGQLFWIVYDPTGTRAGVYSLYMRPGATPQQLTSIVGDPTSCAVDWREERLYYSYIAVGGAGHIAVLDISAGAGYGTQLTTYLLPAGVAATKIDIAGDLLYVVNSNSVVQINKYTGVQVGTIEITFDTILSSVRVMDRETRPKGIPVRVCGTTDSQQLTCPVGGGTISKISAKVYTPTNRAVCQFSHASLAPCSVEWDLSSCIDQDSCEVSLADADVGDCSGKTDLVLDVEYECSTGNTVCNTPGYCPNGMCVVNAETVKECFCDEMFYYNSTDMVCYHETYEVTLSTYNRLASYSASHSPTAALEGLRILPGRAGGFQLVAAHKTQVIWWNNVTKNIYSVDQDTNFGDPTIVIENVNVTSLDVDGSGQVWAVITDDLTDNIRVFKSKLSQQFHLTLYTTTDTSLAILRVCSVKGYIFYTETSAAGETVERRTLSASATSTSIYTPDSGATILAMALDHVEFKLYVALSYGDIVILNYNGDRQNTIKKPSQIPERIAALVVPDKFLMVTTTSGLYKLRKSGDFVETVFGDSVNVTLVPTLAYTTWNEDGGGCEASECTYFCIPNMDGATYQCGCPDDYTMNPQSNQCDGLCLENNGGCAHTCEVSNNNVTCSCHAGYHLASDGGNCIESQDFLLVRLNGILYKYRADSAQDGGSHRVPQLQGLTYFDFDYERKQMIWYNTVKQAIVRGNLTNSHVIHKDANITDVQSIAHDWVSHNVYFIEGARRSRIGVVSGVGSVSKYLITYLHRASHLQLHPTAGLMFFVTFGQGETFEIQQANLDGTNIRKLYMLPSQPSGFAVDVDTGRVYYTLANTLHIYRGDLNQSDIVSVMDTVYYPGEVSAYGGKVVWAETDGKIWSFMESGGVLNIGIINGLDINLKYYSANKYSGDNGCGADNGGCSEFCFGQPVGQLPVCGCGNGVELASDGLACGADPLLLVSRTDIVQAVNIKTKEVTTVLEGLTQAVIVDYDLAERKYYWTDVKDNKIYRADMDGDNREVVVESGVVTPDGMAVDWINRNLYWSDSHTSRFEVVTLTGGYRKSIHIEKLSKPRGICVDPVHSYVYWADWGTFPFIAKMETDGSNMVVLAQQGLAWPNSLSIDLETGKLIWADASRDLIAMMNVDGTEMQILSDSHVDHPFSIDQYMGVIYWSDWYKKSVMSWEYPDGTPEMFLRTEDELQHGVKVVHASRQPQGVRTGCSTNNGGCAQLCFAKPDLSRVCGCSSHMVLLEDQTSCDYPSELLLVARGHEILHVILDSRDITQPISKSVLPIGNITGIVAFDYDVATRRLIIGDNYSGRLESYLLDGSGRQVLASGNIGSIDGIAVDWISGNVFWTDSPDSAEGGKAIIEVVNQEGTARRALVTEDLEKPRAVAVDPVMGHVYWTDWGNTRPGIERIDMNGKNREPIVQNDIVWPNGLVLDLRTHKMYWTDANLDYIGVANMDGGGEMRLVETLIYQPFSITIAGSRLLWTDWRTNTIDAVELNSTTGGEARTTVLENLTNLMTIHYYTSTTQTGNNSCYNNQFGCSHLCLNTPNGPICACKSHLELIPGDTKTCADDPCADNNGGCSHTCALSETGPQCECPELYMLDTDNRTCRASEKSLLIAAHDLIYRVTLDTPQHQISYVKYNSASFSLALGYDSKNERVIYRDSRTGIVSVALTGGDVRLLNDDVNAYSITVDNIAGNLYWVQRNVVKCSRIDGSHIKTLYTGPAGSTVTDITVYPQRQYMFWTTQHEVGSGSVMRAALDGSSRTVIDTNPTRPAGIDIDYRGQGKVYYVDVSAQEYFLISMDFDGRSRNVEYRDTDYRFIDIALDDGTIYWTQAPPDNLYSAKLPGLTDATALLSYLSMKQKFMTVNVYDLAVVNATQPDGQSGCENHQCEGLCFGLGHVSHHCACEDGISVSQTNSSACGKDPVVLRAKRDSIIERDLLTGNDRTVKDGISGVSSVAYHARQNLTVWANSLSDTILGMWTRDGEESEVKTIVGHGIEALKSVDVDYITDKVYWLDTGTHSIGVADLSGKYQTILPLSNVTVITSMALCVRERALFYADSSLQTIFRSGMDGLEQLAILTTTDEMRLVSVLSMTVDQQHNVLYWADTTENYLASANIDGSNAVKITAVTTNYAVSLAVFQQQLYMSERLYEGMVYKIDLSTYETVQYISDEDVPDIKVKHITLQPKFSSPCNSGNNGNCHHLCLLSRHAAEGYTCGCANGLVLAPDGRLCVEPQLSLVVAGRSNILKVSLDSLPTSASVLPFSAHASGAIALAVDVLNNQYFWTDVTKDTIVRGWYNDTGFDQVDIVTTDIKTPDGMVFDWISQILYWTDTAMTHIQACKPNGSSRATIMTGLSKPRALALDSLLGHMYWSEWGNTPRIARADTDGKNSMTLYDEEVGWPNGMALHHQDRILYWADAKLDKIIAYNLKTNIKTDLVAKDMHPFGLAVFDEYVYWTDWQDLAIYRADRLTPGPQTAVVTGWKDLMGIAVLHRQAQPTLSKTNCSYGNGADYRGTNATTISGKTCQRWDMQTPHKHTRTESDFPYSDVGAHNYCRNPDDEPFPWCYTTDPSVRWEYCSIKRCGSVRYEQTSANMTFWDAQARCVTLGGNLATISSDKENNFIRTKVRIDRRALVWIGLINVHGNASLPFLWLSGDGSLYTNFADTFDSTYSANAQWAVAMDALTGSWYRYDALTTLPSTCEIYSKPEGYTTGGNAGGAMCSFPFYHRGSLSYTCRATEASDNETRITDSKFLCGTIALNSNSTKKWGFCHNHALTTGDVDVSSAIRTALHLAPVPYSSSCTLNLMSAVQSHGTTWHGDVIFLNGSTPVLLVGLHPERGNLAIQNAVFSRGVEQWGYHWVPALYPSSRGAGEHETYQFFFGEEELVVTVLDGRDEPFSLISIPYVELTGEKEAWLESIDTVQLGIGEGTQEDVVEAMYWTECQDSNAVSEMRVLADGVERPDILSASPAECITVTNLTVSKNIDLPVQQAYFTFDEGSSSVSSVVSMEVGGVPCTRRPDSTRNTFSALACDTPLNGNLITVLFTQETVLCSAKFMVAENLALGRPATMSNPRTSDSASLAFDGNLAGRSEEDCASSLPSDQRKRRAGLDLSDNGRQYVPGPQYLRVDLGSSVHVAQVLVYMHQNMNPFEVRVGDVEDEVWFANPVCGSWNYKSSSESVKRVNCGRSGRYVTVVVRDETKAISICELEVFTAARPTYGGTAGGAPCQHPFVANDQVYPDGCAVGGTEEGQEDTSWCYTVPPEADQLWGYCQHAADVNSCAFNNGDCSDLCFNTPVGVRCGCADFIKLTDDGKTCEEDPCILPNNGGCEEMCRLGEDGRQCGCRPFRKLNDDGTSCSQSEAFLIGANKTTIFNIALDSDPGALKVVLKDVGNTIGIAYSSARNKIFWTDAGQDAIFSANLDGSDKKLIVSEGVKSPDCIAYDWISDLIYWSDGVADSIEVARYDGKFRNPIISTNTESPRGVALHPMKGQLFWTDWGRKPAIESADMNGGNRNRIITDNIAWPNGITIDYAENRIIWVDAKQDTIESADLNGQDRRIIQNVDVVHPFGATLLGDEIFWTDWGRRSVEAAHKSGSGRRTVYSGIKNPMNIFALSEQSFGSNACSAKPCQDGICIPTSETTYVCKCERLVTPDQDGSCKKEPKLYVAMTDKLVYLDVKIPHKKPVPVLASSSTSVDFDQKEERIYFASSNSIYSADLNGDDFQIIAQTESGMMNYGVASIADISVDWIGRNLYWAEIYSGTIYVCTMNGKYRTAIVQELLLLHSLTISMKERALFFSTWRDPTYVLSAQGAESGIFKVSMDGKGEITQIHNSDSAGSSPWGLLVDYQSRRLFWFNKQVKKNQNEDFILSSGLDGNGITMHHKGVTNLINFLSIQGDLLYYFDDARDSVASFNKTDGTDTPYQLKIDNWADVAGVGMVHPSHQPWVYSKCGTNSANCEHLCLLNRVSDYSCICGLGYTHVSGRGCTRDSKFAVVVTDTGIFEVNTHPESVMRQLPVKLSPSVQGVHINPVSQEIIFLDSSLGRIIKTTFDGDSSTVLIDRFLDDARELCVDFISELMFWVSGDTLQVAKTNGKGRKTVISSGMTSASQLILDGIGGVLRWVAPDNSKWKRVPLPGRVSHAAIRSITYSGTKLLTITLKQVKITSLDASSEHGILIWVNPNSNQIELIHTGNPKINVVEIEIPVVGTVTHVSMINEEIFYRLEVSENGVDGIGYLYRTSLSDWSEHTKLTKLPAAKSLVVYDSSQAYWRGELKEIQSYDKLLPFPDAAQHCISEYQGTLAEIKDLDQNTEILAVHRGQEMWIGLSRSGQKWYWHQDSPAVFFNWAPGEPAFTASSSNDYAAMRDDGLWYAVSKNQTRGFICQRVSRSNNCKYGKAECSDLCFPTDDDYNCGCPDYIELGEDGTTCHADPCATAGCEPDQCYLEKENSPVCTCPAGMVLRTRTEDGSNCTMTNSWLVIATNNAIVSHSLSADVPYVETLMQSYVQSASAIAVDSLGERIFYADGLSHEVFVIYADTRKQEMLFREHVTNSTGLIDMAYDWFDNKLYYANSLLEGDYHIKTRELDNLLNTEVIIIEPSPITSIWLQPVYGYLYYTMADGSVKRCNLDGSDLRVIFNRPDEHYVHGVTADPRFDAIYLATNRTVIKADLDGGNPVLSINYAGEETPSQPTVAVIGSMFYWVQEDVHGDVVSRRIHSVNTVLEVVSPTEKLYHAQLQYVGKYENIKKIAIMDVAVEPGHRVTPHAVSSTKSTKAVIGGIISALVVALVLLVIVVFVRLKRRGFFNYKRLRPNDAHLLSHMEDVTYDNPVYEADDDEAAESSNRLVHMPSTALSSTNNPIEEYKIEVTTHRGYDNDYEVSDDSNGSIFDNDKI